MGAAPGVTLVLLLVVFGCILLCRQRPGFTVLELVGASADHDSAASVLGKRPGGVGIDADGIGDGGSDIGAGHEAQLAFGDLLDKGVIDDELGSERGVGTEPGKGRCRFSCPTPG